MAYAWRHRRNFIAKRLRRKSCAKSSYKPRRFRPMLEWLEDRTVPTLFVVNTFLDTEAVNLLSGQDAFGNVSLRSAIMAANNNPGQDTIQLASGTYTLTRGGVGENIASTGDLDIRDSLTLIGSGATATTINAANLDRVFEIISGVNVTLRNLTITGGRVTGMGGGIFNAGNLTLENTVLDGNSALGQNGTASLDAPGVGGSVNGFGGGVYNSGTLTITNSTFIDNLAQGGHGGTNVSYGSGGGAGGMGAGGGLYNDGGSVTISGSAFINNDAIGGNGGLGGPGNFEQGFGGGGGGDGGNGGFAGSGATSGGNGNYGGGGGGGGSGAGQANGGNGAMGGFGGGGGGGGSTSGAFSPGAFGAAGFGAGNGGFGGNFGGGGGGGGGLGAGGAIFSTQGNLTIINSTLSGNTARGGNGGAVEAAGFGKGGDGGDGMGGGLFGFGGSIQLRSSTIANNEALGGSGGETYSSGSNFTAGVSGTGFGGGVTSLTLGPTVTVIGLGNTIIGDNSSSVNPDVSGAIITLGGTLIENTTGTSIFISGGGNIFGSDPGLAPLADNGGPTQTHALNSGSPALNAGTVSIAPATDQRGFSRDSSPDIGAYEELVYLVWNTNDSGPGSLRQAILNNNASEGGNTITFQIGSLGSSHTIQVGFTGLPVITKQVSIDGWSQGGSNYSGPPLIEIDGINAQDPYSGASGFIIQANNVIIRGFAINRFQEVFGIGGNGVHVISGSGNSIRGNSFFDNEGLGIALGSGSVPNDSGDGDVGANNLQNHPELNSASFDGTSLTIAFVVPSNLANSDYPLDIDFYLADGDGQEGQVYLGSVTYIAADAGQIKLVTFEPNVFVQSGQSIVATATDASNNTSEFSAPVGLQEAPHNISLFTGEGSQIVFEGDTVELSGYFTDNDASETHTVIINWGDGSPDTVLNLGAGITDFFVNHFYDDIPLQGSGLISITVHITDSSGLEGSSGTSLLAENLPPGGDFSNDSNDVPVPEGGSVVVAFVESFDPSQADTDAGFLYSYDFNSDDIFEIVDSSSPTAQVPVEFLASGPGQLVVTGRIRDKDGGFTDYQTMIEIEDVPPQLITPNEAIIGLGQSQVATGSFIDPGLESWSILVDFGDGSEPEFVPFDESKNFVLNHAYASEGNYTVTVTVSEIDGASDEHTFVVYVLPAPPLETDIGYTDRNGVATATIPGQISASLVLPGPTRTPAAIIVSVLPNEVAEGTGTQVTVGTSNADGTVTLKTYDVRVIGASANAQVTVTFLVESPSGQTPLLEFIDPNTGIRRSIQGSTKVSPSFTVRQIPGTNIFEFRVVIDNTSSPSTTELFGTVFTFTGPQAPPPAAPVPNLPNLLIQTNSQATFVSTAPGTNSGGVPTTGFLSGSESRFVVSSSTSLTSSSGGANSSNEEEDSTVAQALQWMNDIHMASWANPEQNKANNQRATPQEEQEGPEANNPNNPQQPPENPREESNNQEESPQEGNQTLLFAPGVLEQLFEELNRQESGQIIPRQEPGNENDILLIPRLEAENSVSAMPIRSLNLLWPLIPLMLGILVPWRKTEKPHPNKVHLAPKKGNRC